MFRKIPTPLVPLFLLFLSLWLPISPPLRGESLEEANRYLKEKNPKKALTVLNLLLEKNPSSPDLPIILRQKGLSLRLLGRHGEAIQSLETSLSLSPEDWTILVSLGAVYWEMGDFNKSLYWYKKGSQKNPGNEKIREKVLSVEKKLDGENKGLKNTTEEKSAQNGESDLSQGRDPQELIKLGFQFFKKKQFQPAYENLKKALALKPKDPEIQKAFLATKKMWTGELNLGGIEALKQKNYTLAIEKFQASFEISPEEKVIAENLVFALRARGDSLSIKDYYTSKELFERALGIIPGDFKTLVSFGILDHKQKLFENAEVHFSQGEKSEKNEKQPDANFHAFRGINFELMGQLDEAEREILFALTLQPDNKDLLFVLDRIRKRKALQKDMTEATIGNFQIRYLSEQGKENIQRIGAALQVGYDRVWQDLDFSTTEAILVVLYSKEDYHKTTSAGWSAGNYDGTINIPLERINLSLETTLAHEYTHYAVDRLSGGKCPKWLNEGLAQYLTDDWGETNSGYFRKLIASKQLSPWNSLSFSHSMSGAQVNYHYVQAYTVVEYLVETQGLGQIANFLAGLKEGMTQDEACYSSFQDGLEGLQKSWLEWSIKKYQ